MEGVLLLTVFIAVLLFNLRLLKIEKNSLSNASTKKSEETHKLWLDLIFISGGLIVLIIGGNVFIQSSVTLAERFHLSEAFIGLTLVAFGTSLPELATSIMAALRKHSDIALGNVLGSNVYNILGIAGITALIKPIPVSAHMVKVDIPVMIAVSVALFVLAVVVRRFGKRVGYAFLAGYAVYIYALVA